MTEDSRAKFETIKMSRFVPYLQIPIQVIVVYLNSFINNAQETLKKPYMTADVNEEAPKSAFHNYSSDD